MLPVATSPEATPERRPSKAAPAGPVLRPAPGFLALGLGDGARRRAREIARSGDGFPTDGPDAGPDAWERTGEARLRAILDADGPDVGRLLRASPLLRIRGLPAEADPGPSPYEGLASVAAFRATIAHVMGVIRLMGARAFAFADENDGRIVRHVVARPGAAAEVSSQGWGAELPWHMDGAFRPFPHEACGDPAPPPRWLVFGVIRARPDLPIVAARIEDVVARLGPTTRRALEAPEFAVASPQAVAERRVLGPLPLLAEDADGHLISRISLGNCRGLTPGARAALGALEHVLEARALHRVVPTRPGDVIVLDNWRTLHRRAAYQPAWDGGDRWFVRVFAQAATDAAITRVLP